MIKINVILNNIIWKKYLRNPHSFIDKKIGLLNKKNKLYKKLLRFDMIKTENKFYPGFEWSPLT